MGRRQLRSGGQLRRTAGADEKNRGSWAPLTIPIRLAACIGLAAVLGIPLTTVAQKAGGPAGEGAGVYRLPLPVDEVVVTFHAQDAFGLPVNDLKAGEVRVFDNEQPPRRIVAFDSLLDRSIRAGILVDTSESMEQALSTDKSLATQFLQRFFRQNSDQAFVMDFGYSSEIAQPWTNRPGELSKSVGHIQSGKMNPLGGTAIFDTIFRACLYGFKDVDPYVTSNFILLFSDGEDTASHTALDEALKTCQRENISIYAIRTPSPAGRDSLGPMTLNELALRSGGRVFRAPESEDEIWRDLRTIESESRNQYRLVYDPAQLKHDGSFHRIAILPPDRVSTISVRSGYYAPNH
jgi:Ca-activated chloride channel family protein